MPSEPRSRCKLRVKPINQHILEITSKKTIHRLQECSAKPCKSNNPGPPLVELRTTHAAKALCSRATVQESRLERIRTSKERPQDTYTSENLDSICIEGERKRMENKHTSAPRAFRHAVFNTPGPSLSIHTGPCTLSSLVLAITGESNFGISAPRTLI
ncbi:hypothetical protein B0H12DRAFT_1078020 [Mycena haematopus]|nr:hypothetical protein B0H12DRAFT_1078020 [Mycena haematopus]